MEWDGKRCFGRIFSGEVVCIASLGVGGFLLHELREPAIETDPAAKGDAVGRVGMGHLSLAMGLGTASTEVCRLV